MKKAKQGAAENERETDDLLTEAAATHDTAGETGSEKAAPEAADALPAGSVAQSEYDALNDRYLRLYAEYENYRKRTAKEKEALFGDCAAQITGEWLPVIDNLFRAAEAAAQFASDVDRSIIEGIELVLKQAEGCLARLGVEAIEALGAPFDPMFHEAVMQAEHEGAEPGTVVEEFKKGYRRGDRVIRHSVVKVAN